ncbi:MAG TPA: alpha/beta hydrolase [Gemmatimonadetes bacterium]|jgi:acetyl esterase/lipase|nr:alpha/beta hydrolase [Gemmatimonadota bacterium]
MKTLTRATFATLTLLCLAIPLQGQNSGSIMPDLVYGHKAGMALTLDVFRPASPNGASVLNMVSGGWVSRWRDPEQAQAGYQALLDQGFTVFAIRHGSSPRFNVPEAYADVTRAVRYVRLHAPHFGLDAERIGVYGGSAGGHLSLMLGLNSDEGDPNAADEVLRHSSRVAAVVANYPPVDLRPRATPSERFPATIPDQSLFFAGGVVPGAAERFVAIDVEDEAGASVSPILFVTPDDPPTLLIHGDADALVDFNNSELMQAALMASGVETGLVVIEGAGHGFRTPEDRAQASDALVGWFVEHLSGR